MLTLYNASVAERKSSLAELRNLLPRMPFNTLIGLTVHKVHKDGVTVALAVEKKVHNAAGTLHGGALATLADAAAGMATYRHYGGRPITTVELKISYFRPASEGRVYSRARLARTGATLSVAQVEIRDASKNLLAIAIVTYLLMESRGDGRMDASPAATINSKGPHPIKLSR